MEIKIPEDAMGGAHVVYLKQVMDSLPWNLVTCSPYFFAADECSLSDGFTWIPVRFWPTSKSVSYMENWSCTENEKGSRKKYVFQSSGNYV